MATRIRLKTADVVLRGAQTTERASAEHAVRAVTPSAMTTTTFTAPNVDDTMLMCIAIPEDGDARGLARQIKSRASTVATVDAAWPSVSGVTRIRIWVLPDKPMNVTTGHATNVISTDHAGLPNEPDGYWANGDWMLVCKGGANAGQAFPITGFTAASGTFVVSGTPAAHSVGDTYEIRQMLKLEADLEVSFDQKILERGFIGGGEIAADVGVPITAEGSATLTMAAQSLSSAGSSGVQAGRPKNLYSMLDDYFDWHRDTGGTVVAADATTLNLSSSVLTQGGFVLLPTGDVIHVYLTDGQDVSGYGTGQMNHAAVTVGGTAHAAAWCARKKNDFRHCTLDFYPAGMDRFLLPASMAKVMAKMERDQLLLWTFEYALSEGFAYMVDRPVAVGATNPLVDHDLTTPRDGKGTICKIDGISVNVTNLTYNPGLTPVVRKGLTGVNQAAGCYMKAEIAERLTFRVTADQDDLAGMVTFQDRIRRRKHCNMIIVEGSAATETRVIGVPAAQFTKVSRADDDGDGVYDCEVICVKPAKAFGSNAYANLPPCSIGWL